MGAQKGSFLGSGGREVLDRGSETLDLGSGRPFFDQFWTQIWDDPQGAVPHTKQPPRYGFWRALDPQKGSILGHFWALFDHFWWGPLRGPSLRATLLWMFRARGPKTAKKWPFLSVFGAFSTQRRKGGGFGGGLMKKTSYFETPWGGLKSM